MQQNYLSSARTKDRAVKKIGFVKTFRRIE